jgi:hypothetical protein
MKAATISLRSCGTCGALTNDRCAKGHPFCKRCQEELDACEVCLESRADEVRGIP